MITVTIFINDTPVFTRSAVNRGLAVKATTPDECAYDVDDGSVIIHKRGDGAVKLAKAMLDTIKEPK